MKKSFLVIVSLFLGASACFTQHNMLGKSQRYIRSFYNLANEYALKVDTIGQKTILLTYKTEKQYPFYTYEVDLFKDQCISYGVVSKDNSTLKSYLDVLNYLGELVEVDSTYNNFVYKVETEQKTSFFTIKQPYFNSQFLTRRSVFYILVTEQHGLTTEQPDNEKKDK
jgi:hypothetical protein